MSRRLRAFKRWMRSQGIEFSDALEIVENNEGISVHAHCNLKEGDLVATIPKRACLTTKTTGAHEMIDDTGLGGCLGLCVALMFERGLGEGSLWHGYLQLLPEKESVPLVWTLDEVDTLLVGTELHKIVKDDKALLYDDWRECILPLISANPLKLNPDSFGVEQYFAAKSLVASRAFEIDDFHGFGMVPFADLFNHKTGAENVHFSVSSGSESEAENEERNNDDVENESGQESSIEDERAGTTDDDHTPLEMIVVRDVEAGNEVFNTYGSMGNAALLHRYGFTEPDNPYDIVNIDLDLVLKWSSSLFSDRYSRARLSLWRKLDYAGCISQNSEYFEVSFQGEPQMELIVLIYIFLLPELRYNELNCTLACSGDLEKAGDLLLLTKVKHDILPETREKTRSSLLTKRVCEALVTLAEMRESAYVPNSLADDLNALRSCCKREGKLYHSLVLRVSERTILEKLKAYANWSFSNRKRAEIQ